MPRFFYDGDGQALSSLGIRGDDARHIARSLRMAVGDEITVCDTRGVEYRCRLSLIRDDLCTAEVISSRQGTTESPAELTLYMAYPKGDKLETVVQKAVELGVSHIIPFASSRCIRRPKADREEKQTARLQRIAEEAAKQCGRSRLPTVSPAVSFSSVLKPSAADLRLFCYEGSGTRSLRRVLEEHPHPAGIEVVVGPEGGFSEEEAGAAAGAGFVPVNLGPRILRCETAPAYVLSVISAFLEL